MLLHFVLRHRRQKHTVPAFYLPFRVARRPPFRRQHAAHVTKSLRPRRETASCARTVPARARSHEFSVHHGSDTSQPGAIRLCLSRTTLTCQPRSEQRPVSEPNIHCRSRLHGRKIRHAKIVEHYMIDCNLNLNRLPGANHRTRLGVVLDRHKHCLHTHR